MIDEYKEKINVINEVLTNMPKTNKKNTDEFKKKALEIINVSCELQKDLYDEITKRYNNIILSINKSDINEEEINKTLNTLIDYLRLKNDITSPYEKLNIDKYIYELNINLNDNLKKLNQIIVKLFETFKKCNIFFSSKTFIAGLYCCSGSEIARIALACPADIISSTIICCKRESSFKSLIEFVTAVRLFETRSAISSCFK